MRDTDGLPGELYPMPKRAWTPGPWRVARMAHDYGRSWQVIAPPVRPDGLEQYVTQAWQEKSADPQLIALAPEMAEAILAFADNPMDPHDVFEMAEKLLMIGGSDD